MDKSASNPCISVTPSGQGVAQNNQREIKSMKDDIDINDIPDVFTVRLLELKAPFYRYIWDRNLDRSAAIRHFVKQGISESSSLSMEQKKAVVDEISMLRKAHGSIGTNLNQTARYFNKFGHLIEGDLHKSHKELLANQKAITKLINELLAKL